MAYVILQSCCNDAVCVDVCPADCIHPRPGDPEFQVAEQLYIDPANCIDCNACLEACPVDAIVPVPELRPDQEPFAELNARYFETRGSVPA